MHDFILAKEIVDELLRIAEKRKLDKIQKVSLEIGKISHGDHIEDINPSNLTFSLKCITQKYGLDKAKYEIKPATGTSWKITNIEV